MVLISQKRYIKNNFEKYLNLIFLKSNRAIKNLPKKLLLFRFEKYTFSTFTENKINVVTIWDHFLAPIQNATCMLRVSKKWLPLILQKTERIKISMIVSIENVRFLFSLAKIVHPVSKFLTSMKAYTLIKYASDFQTSHFIRIMIARNNSHTSLPHLNGLFYFSWYLFSINETFVNK